MKNIMQLKDLIKNLAKEKNINSQSGSFKKLYDAAIIIKNH